MSNNQHIAKLKTWLSENFILVFIYLFALVFIGLFLFAPSSSQQVRILEEELRVYFHSNQPDTPDAGLLLTEARYYDRSAVLNFEYRRPSALAEDFDRKLLAMHFKDSLISKICSNPVFEDALNQPSFKYISVNVKDVTNATFPLQLTNIKIRKKRCVDWSPPIR